MLQPTRQPCTTPDRRRLVDGFGRLHTSMRISVTDRCNIRCFYCMPAEDVRFKPRRELLTFDEIERVVRVLVGWGIDKIRLTGGEPLVRQDLAGLVTRLARVEGLRDLALTTNGILLSEQAAGLKAAGLRRLNISLDTLRRETFEQISRRDELDRVLEGIEAARRVGFDRIRLNAVALRGLTEADVVPLATFARERGLELRFIEYMPLDAERRWDLKQVLSGADIQAILERAFGPLVPLVVNDSSQPAVDFEFADGAGRIGFIRPVTKPFCANCNRLRLTAEGQLRNCLFSTVEWDARAVLRDGGCDEDLVTLVQSCLSAKAAGHGINSQRFVQPDRAMYQIGG